MRRIASDVVIERLWTDLLIETEIGVRDPIALVDVMLGQVAAQNQMHTKQIDERQSPIAKRTIARVVLQILYSLLPEGVIAQIAILTDPTAVAVTTL